MITRFSLVLAVFCLIAQTTYGDATGNQFIGGPGSEVATTVLFPSFVIVALPNNVQCGGFIVNSLHVVTAGSCVLDANQNLVSAALSQVRFPTAIQTQLGVERIFVHEHFNPWTFDNDIAVIRTIGAILIQEGVGPNIFAAELNDRMVQDNQPCTLVGMSVAEPSVFTSRQQNVMARSQCNSPAVYNNRVVASQFCAGGLVAQGPCELNRGGPLFCDGQVAGVLSNGFSCNIAANLNMPGVYTQIRRYIPWITQQFNRTTLTPPGPTQAPTFPSGQSNIAGYMSLIVVAVVALIYAG